MPVYNRVIISRRYDRSLLRVGGLPRIAGRITLLTLLFTLLAGCSTMGEIDPPAKWCTAPAKKFESPKEGDDLVQTHAEMMVEWEREKSKNRCLQRYANAVAG